MEIRENGQNIEKVEEMKYGNVIIVALLIIVPYIIIQSIDVDEPTPDTVTPNSPTGWKFLPYASGYHDYYEAKDFIENITATFPEITYLNSSIGQSIEGRDIFALKISDNPSQDENETKVLFHAQIHAREVITLENILALISHVCNHYDTDSNITQLVDDREIWFIPVLNPDGALYCAYNDSTWRKNRRDNGYGEDVFGVDLNRNFAHQWGGKGSSAAYGTQTYRGSAPFSEPESQALRDFVLSHEFSGVISMHSYGGLWLWPWGYTIDFTPDDILFRAIAEELSQLQLHYPYVAQSTNSFLPVSGTAGDWLYGECGILTYTIEIYSGPRREKVFYNFNPPSDQIQYEVENNIPAFLYFIDIVEDPQQVFEEK